MKFDIDCVRDVMLVCEQIPYNESFRISDLKNALSQYSEDEISYVCLKLKEANYLSVITKTLVGKVVPLRVVDVTFEGHQFLANIKQDTIWKKVKSVLPEIGSQSFSTIMSVAANIATEALNTFFK